MNKVITLATLTAIFVAGVVSAQQTQAGWGLTEDGKKLVVNKIELRGKNSNFSNQGSETIAGDQTITGDQTVSGNITVAGDVVATGDVWGRYIIGDPAGLTWQLGSQSVTNGQVVALSDGRINILRGTGSPNANTNTITLANVTSANLGKVTYIANASDATNKVRIVKTGNFYGATIELGAGDSMIIYAGVTNVLYGK